MIDPEVPPPLPPSVVADTVYLADGTAKQVVTVLDAAKLSGTRPSTIATWISHGRIAICLTPDHEKRVFVESLWRSYPLEMRR